MGTAPPLAPAQAQHIRHEGQVAHHAGLVKPNDGSGSGSGSGAGAGAGVGLGVGEGETATGGLGAGDAAGFWATGGDAGGGATAARSRGAIASARYGADDGSTLTRSAAACSARLTAAGPAPGAACSSSAAAPATCGVAIEVPDMVASPVSLAYEADTIAAPGANAATHAPMLENEASASVFVVAPTVIACGADAGLCVHASAPRLLP